MDEYPFYIEELVILTIICFLLLIAKLVVCCQSLGLHQNHKALNRRQDYLTIARLNNLQVERISLQEPKIKEVITCICKCPQTPSTSAGILPKLESTNPCLKFPEKILVCPRNQCWHAFLAFDGGKVKNCLIRIPQRTLLTPIIVNSQIPGAWSNSILILHRQDPENQVCTVIKKLMNLHFLKNNKIINYWTPEQAWESPPGLVTIWCNWFISSLKLIQTSH